MMTEREIFLISYYYFHKMYSIEEIEKEVFDSKYSYHEIRKVIEGFYKDA